MSIQKLADKIRLIQKEKPKDKSEQIDLCFELMEKHCLCDKTKRVPSDSKNCIYAALTLSGIVQKGLAKRTIKFLDKFEKNLPISAVVYLRSNVMRMETL